MEKQEKERIEKEAREANKKELEVLVERSRANLKTFQETVGEVFGLNKDYDIVSKRRRFSEWISLFLIGFMLGILVTIL